MLDISACCEPGLRSAIDFWRLSLVLRGRNGLRRRNQTACCNSAEEELMSDFHGMVEV
jgi:hypothetical protein